LITPHKWFIFKTLIKELPVKEIEPTFKDILDKFANPTYDIMSDMLKVGSKNGAELCTICGHVVDFSQDDYITRDFLGVESYVAHSLCAAEAERDDEERRYEASLDDYPTFYMEDHR
jgi:hypothetical protein